MAGALVPSRGQGSSSSFAQQGSLDWVSLARSPVTFSVDVLARFSKAGVEMITVAVGRAMCAQFDLKPDAQKRLEESLSKLKTFSSYGKVIWFGFGLKHVLNDLAESEQGATLLALCGALTVSYDAFYASQVLREMCKTRNAPDELTPSLRQWRGLVDVCAGCLSGSQFPLLLSGFERLFVVERPEHDAPAPTDAKSLAEALSLLAKVSTGSLRSVSFSGGLDCAWIAATAQWILSLGVELVNSAGECVYRSSALGGSQSAQVVIFLGEGRSNSGAVLVHKTFVVPRGRNLLELRLSDTENPIRRISAREHLLSSTFGQVAVSRLLDAPGNPFGRLLKFVSSLSPEVVFNILPWKWNKDIGSDFLGTIQARLPELGTCISQVEQQNLAGSDLEIYRQLIDYIRDLCSCNSFCCADVRADAPRQYILLIPPGSDVCLSILSCTIIYYLRLLSALVVEDHFYLSCSGLRTLYMWCHSGFCGSREFIYGRVSSGQFLPQISPLEYKLISLDAAFHIVTGQRPLPSGAPSATSLNGICMFYSVFNDLDVSPLRIDDIHIVFGNITHSGSLFTHIVDSYTYPGIDFEALGGQSTIVNDDEFACPTVSRDLTYELVVKETEISTQIEAFYTVSSLTTKVATSVSLLHAIGLVTAPRVTDLPATMEFDGTDRQASHERDPLNAVTDRPWSLITTKCMPQQSLQNRYKFRITLEQPSTYLSMYYKIFHSQTNPRNYAASFLLVRVNDCPRCVMSLGVALPFFESFSDYELWSGFPRPSPAFVEPSPAFVEPSPAFVEPPPALVEVGLCTIVRPSHASVDVDLEGYKAYPTTGRGLYSNDIFHRADLRLSEIIGEDTASPNFPKILLDHNH